MGMIDAGIFNALKDWRAESGPRHAQLLAELQETNRLLAHMAGIRPYPGTPGSRPPEEFGPVPRGDGAEPETRRSKWRPPAR